MTLFLLQVVILALMGLFFVRVFSSSVKHQMGERKFSYPRFAVEFVIFIPLTYILIRVGYPLGHSRLTYVSYGLALVVGVVAGVLVLFRNGGTGSASP